jgi:hypothetical protein
MLLVLPSGLMLLLPFLLSVCVGFCLQAVEQYKQLVTSAYAAALTLQQWQISIDSISCAGNTVFSSSSSSSSTRARRILLQEDDVTAWDATADSAGQGVAADPGLTSTTAEADLSASYTASQQDASSAAAAAAPALSAVEVVSVFTVQVPVARVGAADVTEAVLLQSSSILTGPLSTFFAAVGAPIGSSMRIAGSSSSIGEAAGEAAALQPGITAAAAAPAWGLVFEAAALNVTEAAATQMLPAVPAAAPATAPAVPETVAAAAVPTTATAEHQLPGLPAESSGDALLLSNLLLPEQQQQVSLNPVSTQHNPADFSQQQQQQQESPEATEDPTGMLSDASQASTIGVTAYLEDTPADSSPDRGDSAAVDDARRIYAMKRMIEAAAAAAAESMDAAVQTIRELA